MFCHVVLFHNWSEWQSSAYTYTNKKGIELIVPKEFRYCQECHKTQIRIIKFNRARVVK